MIWLASYPRSGNTFLRNILYDVYGIKSSIFSLKDGDNTHCFNDPVVKTHLLPHQLPDKYSDRKSVYLIRDGRDADVSLAYHRKDVKENNLSYQRNLFEVIRGKNNAFPGGWSHHVEQWTSKANIIIRYEDLIMDPIGEVERLRDIISLPQPNKDKIPQFSDLKKGQFSLGTKKLNDAKGEYRIVIANKFFRRGKAGSFKEEMPPLFRILFWMKNRKMMKKFNYY